MSCQLKGQNVGRWPNWLLPNPTQKSDNQGEPFIIDSNEEKQTNDCSPQWSLTNVEWPTVHCLGWGQAGNMFILLDALIFVVSSLFCCCFCSLFVVRMLQPILSPFAWSLIPFPVFMSHIHFQFLLVLLLSFEVSSHQRGKSLYLISDLIMNFVVL